MNSLGCSLPQGRTFAGLDSNAAAYSEQRPTSAPEGLIGASEQEPDAGLSTGSKTNNLAFMETPATVLLIRTRGWDDRSD
jgi:hypothetical protein